MILRAEPFGTPEICRYIIIDLETKKVWNGEEFVEGLSNGSKYASPNAACSDMQALLKNHYKHLPVKKYVVPLEIEIYGDEDIQDSDISEWMYRSTVLNMKTHEHGNGPADSLICPTIHWGMIQESVDGYFANNKIGEENV